MDINITLVIQMLVFAAFVWFTMAFVWPPLSKALDERQTKIADALAAAERGRREFELAQHHAKEELRQAKIQAADLIEKANRRATQLIEEAKVEAKTQAQIIAKASNDAMIHEMNHAKQVLQQHVAGLAMMGASKIIKHSVDEALSRSLIDELIKEI